MRVLVTGASGHIGSAVVHDLLAAGHEPVGLVRSDASAAAVAATGAAVRRGDLTDLDGLRAAARDADGVLHLAFDHDAMRAGDFPSAIATDLRVVEALGDALAGSGRPLAIASGTLLLAGAGLGRSGTETDSLPGGPRIDAENTVIALAERGVRSSAVRLPPIVHGPTDRQGFLPTLVDLARSTGTAGYVGDGANRWPAVHTLDAARLFRLALGAPAGSRLHAVDDEGVPFRAIAEAIARRLGVPATGIAPEAADAHFGFLGPLVALDNPTSATHTRDVLGWAPTQPGLMEDLEQGHYLRTPATHG